MVWEEPQNGQSSEAENCLWIPLTLSDQRAHSVKPCQISLNHPELETDLRAAAFMSSDENNLLYDCKTGTVCASHSFPTSQSPG
jgi:hypothetical protein